MRREIARLRRHADATQPAFEIALQFNQRRRRSDTRHDRARLVAAEPAKSLEIDGYRRMAHGRQRIGDFARGMSVDVSDEAQGDVIVGWLDPAGAEYAAARRRQSLPDLSGNGQSGEQTRHDGLQSGAAESAGSNWGD